MLLDKIAIIDDDARIIQSLKIILGQYHIVSFQNGDEALDYLKRPNEVKLVLLDVFMGGEMSGISILREIKKIASDIAVIIMTGYGTKDIAIEALRADADDFIEKPFNIEEVKDKIQVLLREKSYLTREHNNHNEKIVRIKQFIHKNRTLVSLEDISSEMCLCPKYVSRLFRKKTGKSFRSYKLAQKIKLAKTLLLQATLTVKEIAERLGYENAESFMKMFKKNTGCTPTQFREDGRLQASLKARPSEKPSKKN